MKARVQLKANPGARKTGFAGQIGAVWKLNVAAPAVGGKANHEIIQYFSKICGVSQSAIRIVSGAGNRLKLIEVDGLDSCALNRVILEAHASGTDSGSAPPRKA